VRPCGLEWNLRVPEIFGNKPAIERERALGKGRAKAGKPVLAMSFNHRLKLKKKKARLFVANRRSDAESMFQWDMFKSQA